MRERGSAGAPLDGFTPKEGIVATIAGATITHVAVPAMASVIARNGKAGELKTRLAQQLGLELPLSPRVVSAAGLSLAWAGHGQWLAKSESEDGQTLEERLRVEFVSLAAVSDQSDSRVLVRVEGAGARDLLARHLPIDLHPGEFACGAVALTLFGHIGVHVWMMAATPTFDILVPRSYAASFWRALLHESP